MDCGLRGGKPDSSWPLFSQTSEASVVDVDMISSLISSEQVELYARCFKFQFNFIQLVHLASANLFL